MSQLNCAKKEQYCLRHFTKMKGRVINNIAPNLKDQDPFKRKLLGEQMALATIWGNLDKANSNEEIWAMNSKHGVIIASRLVQGDLGNVTLKLIDKKRTLH